MKRYLLFGFYEYYPNGGLRDIIQASFNNINELDLDRLYCDYDYYQLLDLKTGHIAELEMLSIENEIEKNEIYDFNEVEKYKRNAIINWLNKHIVQF